MRFADDARLESYERRTATPMVVLAGAFLAIYTVQVVPPGMPHLAVRLLVLANALIWLVFAADLAYRLMLSEKKWRFLLSHPIDIASVLVPALRPVRAVTAVTSSGRTLGTRSGLLRTGQAILISAGVLIYVGALAMLSAERGAPGALITTFGDALWWALVTVTTVGYGDAYPVTAQGRVVASVLMVLGISVLGAVTATAASWLLHSNDEKDEASIAKNEAQIKALHRKVDALERKIDRLLEHAGDARDPKEKP